MPTRLSTLLLSFLAAGLLAQPAGADPGGEGAPAEGAWVIWYRHPADKWEHAFPAGNGRLGAMVFGGVERERIQLNEDTLWAGYPRDRQNPRAFEALAEVRRLLFEGKNNEAADLAAAARGRCVPRAPGPSRRPHPAGPRRLPPPRDGGAHGGALRGLAPGRGAGRVRGSARIDHRDFGRPRGRAATCRGH